MCHKHNIPLFVDGARLAYALASPDNYVSLFDRAHLCDVFYIGGTKCGALLGEAVVVPDPDRIPHFITIIKQHGALLAKGRLLGIQFDELFKNCDNGKTLYENIGNTAVYYAAEIKQALLDNGYKLCFDSPTNQVFIIIENSKMEKLAEKVVFSFWGKYDETHTIIRFATNWATTKESIIKLTEIIQSL